MKKRKINLWDKCGQHVNPHQACATTKAAKKVEFATDGSGEIDVFTHDAFDKVSTHGFTNIKIGWLQEPRAINSFWYTQFEQDPDAFFDRGFDFLITHDQKLLDTDPRCKFILGNGFWIDTPMLYKKSKLISMIASSKQMCEGHRYRLDWVSRLTGKVDLFGRGINPIENKEQGLCDYMFSVAIENEKRDAWITEKVLDCFASGTIPIYHGTEKIVEHFNPDGIIFLTDDFDPSKLTADMYYDRMDAVKDNLERVIQIERPVDFIFDQFF